MSTIAPQAARRLSDLHREFGGHYVASPVFGKPEVAAHAKLWIATAGAGAARARVRRFRKPWGSALLILAMSQAPPT
jgi:3-hydroxyisobutyrate dehydrogenase-like beta-hydroxyacid dehydrogenase